VASGLDALEISLKILGCGPGDRVLVSPISAFATALAVVRLGAIPVFVDSDASGSMSLDAAEEVLRARPEIRFMLPVHLYGNSLDLERLERLRDGFGLVVVEDCAQSVLASYRGKPTGSVGQMAATSFYPTKNLGALGDAGAILTGDPEKAKLARAYRDYGKTGEYEHSYIGYNSRLDELQAAIVRRAHLPRLAKWVERRRAIAAAYEAGIRSPHIRICSVAAGSVSSRHLFPATVAPALKRQFMEWLRSRGVGGGEHYPMPLMDQPAMRNVACETMGGCATAREFCRSQVSLPVHPYLSEEQIAYVVDVCNAWDPQSHKEST